MQPRCEGCAREPRRPHPPRAGEGPSEKTQNNGYFAMDISTTATGARYASRAAAQGRSRIPGHRGPTGGVGTEPGARSRPAPRRGRCPHPGHRARRRPGRTVRRGCGGASSHALRLMRIARSEPRLPKAFRSHALPALRAMRAARSGRSSVRVPGAKTLWEPGSRVSAIRSLQRGADAFSCGCGGCGDGAAMDRPVSGQENVGVQLSDDAQGLRGHTAVVVEPLR